MNIRLNTTVRKNFKNTHPVSITSNKQHGYGTALTRPSPTEKPLNKMIQ